MKGYDLDNNMVNRIYLQLFYFGTLSVNWDFWFSRILQPEIILNNRKFPVAQMKAYKNDKTKEEAYEN